MLEQAWRLTVDGELQRVVLASKSSELFVVDSGFAEKYNKIVIESELARYWLVTLIVIFFLKMYFFSLQQQQNKKSRSCTLERERIGRRSNFHDVFQSVWLNQ